MADRLVASDLGEVLARSEMVPVGGLTLLSVSVGIEVNEVRPGKYPALITFSFLDADLEPLSPEPGPDLFLSKRFGTFLYLGDRGQVGEISFRRQIPVPAGAAQAEVTVRKWYADSAVISTSLQAKGMQGLGKPASTNVVGVADAVRVTLTADMLVEGMHPSRAPALAALVFTGPGGKEMEGPHPRLHQSDRYGSFVYLGEPAREGNVPARVTFPIPPGAIKMSARIFPWGAKSLSLMEEPSFVLNFDGAGTAEGSLIATIDAPVRAGEAYEIGYRQSTAIESFNKFALLRPHFSDRAGQQVAAVGLSVSRRFGSYQYLTQPKSDDRSPGSASAAITAPTGAVRVRADVHRWRMHQEPGEVALEAKCLDSDDAVCARGDFRLVPHVAEVVVCGEVRASGRLRRKAGILELIFEGEEGERLAVQADGLEGNDTFLNVIELQCRREDGAIPLQFCFTPPEGAARIVWRLRPEPGVVLEMAGNIRQRSGDASISSILHVLSTASKVAHEIDSGLAWSLRARLPLDEFWTGVCRGQFSLLAEGFCATQPHEWVVLQGRLNPKGRLPRSTRIRVYPVYFAADGRVLHPKELPGCHAMGEAGLVREATSLPLPDGPIELDEAFLTPAGASTVAFYIVAAEPGIDAEVDRLTVGPADPDTIHQNLDTTRMDQVRLQQAFELAEKSRNLPARQALAFALASFDLTDPKLTRRAEVLAGDCAELAPDWLPALTQQRPFDADPSAILHLFKVIYPDENSGGAVRSTAIVESQAAKGLHPIVCMPLNAPCPATELPETDGIHEVMRNGVRVCYSQYPGLDRSRIAATDMLSLEAALANRVARRHRVSLVHAASGFRGFETALKGIALARANSLPFVYEVRSFHEHTWRPVVAPQIGDSVTHLRMAQEDRCMQMADAVVTISQAMVGNLQDRGVPAERLFFVPNAIDRTFETLPEVDDIRAFRRGLGLLGATTVGYISNFSEREGHKVLLDAFTRLVAQGHDLHLVMVGDGPERHRLIQHVRERGLSKRVVMPGNVDHTQVRNWYHAIDLFVVPRIPDFASDYVTPLKPFEAMAQNIPIIMSNRPVTAEIAGEAGERATVFPAGDDIALAGLIAAELGDRARLKERTARARSWVMAERVWSSVIERYEVAYEAARRFNAARLAGGRV